MLILGVDPGIEGALALYDTTVEKIVSIWDMPTKSIMVSGKARKAVCPHGVVDMFRAIAATHAVIEKVGGIRGQSASAAFNFGAGYGAIMAAAAALDIEIDNPAPILWKAKLKVPAKKEFAIAKATEMVPYMRDQWPLKKHDGRAEAAMLALYGRRHVWTL
jgi:crossover junction endodeoxyribonuclease RuvC